MGEIKPCPLCGHEAELMDTLEHGGTDDPPSCHVYCPRCLAQGPSQALNPDATTVEKERTERRAIAAWNRRCKAMCITGRAFIPKSRLMRESACWMHLMSFRFYVKESTRSPTGYAVYLKGDGRRICNTQQLYPHGTAREILGAGFAALQDLRRVKDGRELLALLLS
jgi:Lar family restriction alleviation protein